MPIVFAENFQNDTLASIAQRYPGTVRTTVAGIPDTGAFPLNLSTNKFVGPFKLYDPQVNQRLELVMDMDTIAGGRNPGYAANIFGFTVSATATTTTFNGVALPIADYATENMKKWHFILDSVWSCGPVYRLTVIIDGVLRMKRQLVAYTPSREITLSLSNPAGVPKYVKSIVIAYDTDPKKHLDNVAMVKRDWTVSSPGAWTYSDTGYVPDTDKQDGLTLLPSVRVAGESTMTVDLVPNADADANLIANVVHTSGRREANELSRITVGNDARNLSQDQAPAVPTIVPAADLLNITSIRGATNSQGLVFFGERSDVITYSDLSTALGFAAGSVNTTASANKWLHLALDGVEMLVAKVAVRYGITWYQIYSAGLVYGLDDVGLYPLGTPTNQLRTVTLGGKVYKVRLLKGGDADPVLANGYDPADTQNSEWSRIFYPLVTDDTNAKSYTGPNLYPYTVADLQMRTVNETTAPGSRCWCQELMVNETYRITRGGAGPSYLAQYGYNTTNSLGDTLGWRPVLERIS